LQQVLRMIHYRTIGIFFDKYQTTQRSAQLLKKFKYLLIFLFDVWHSDHSIECFSWKFTIFLCDLISKKAWVIESIFLWQITMKIFSFSVWRNRFIFIIEIFVFRRIEWVRFIFKWNFVQAPEYWSIILNSMKFLGWFLETEFCRNLF